MPIPEEPIAKLDFTRLKHQAIIQSCAAHARNWSWGHGRNATVQHRTHSALSGICLGMTVAGAKYHRMFEAMRPRLEDFCHRNQYTFVPFVLSNTTKYNYHRLIECKWAMMVDALNRGCE